MTDTISSNQLQAAPRPTHHFPNPNPWRTLEVPRGKQIPTLQSTEDPLLQQMDVPWSKLLPTERSCWNRFLAGPMERSPCRSFFVRTCDPMGDSYWSSLFLKDCTLRKEAMLEQLLKDSLQGQTQGQSRVRVWGRRSSRHKKVQADHSPQSWSALLGGGGGGNGLGNEVHYLQRSGAWKERWLQERCF